MDPSAERDHAYSPYCYAANNPVRYIDPDGRWFDEKDLRKANRLERKETRQIEKLTTQRDKLSAQGKDIGDLNDRIGQLHQSVSDVRWMKSDLKVEYKYASANSKSNPAGVGNPVTSETGTNKDGETTQVTMFVGGSTGQQIHESRHGGDVARGTLDPSPYSKNYGVSNEVSAYRAQYSYDGSFSYQPADSPLKSYAPATTVNNIGLIDASLVNNIGTVRSYTAPNGTTATGWGPLYPTSTKQWKDN